MGFREARIRAGLRVTDVMQALGVSVAAVSHWETGRYVPRTQKLLKIASLYGCAVEDLLTNVSEEKSEKTD